MKKVHFDLKLKLNGKRLYPTKSVKYLGIKIDESLTLNEHINDIAIKLNRANAMLYKVREFVNIRVLKLKQNLLFSSQKKALRIINFECRNAHLNVETLFSIGMK